MGIETIILLLGKYGYLVIFPISVLEGPIVSIAVGFLVSLGTLHPAIAFLVLLAGDIAGDVFYYYLGRWGHGSFTKSLAMKLGATPERLLRFERDIKENDIKLLALNKLHAAGSLLLFFAGATRMNLTRFIVINTLASVPKVAVFLFLGYWFGTGYRSIGPYLDAFGILSLLLPIIFLLWYMRWGHTKENPHV